MGKRQLEFNRSGSTTLFQIEGRFLGFAIADGYKLKYARIQTAEGDRVVKLAKELRASIQTPLVPGEWLHLSGTIKDGEKLKAYAIERFGKIEGFVKFEELAQIEGKEAARSDRSSCPPGNKVKVLVCQKSDCVKRGGAAICQSLMAALSDRGLADRVAIQGTGCLKRCESGPNLVVMPDKSRYTHVRAADLPEIVDAIAAQLV